MGKKSRRNVGFEESDDNSDYHDFELEHNATNAFNSDEGECDDESGDLINSDNVEFDDGYDEDLMGDDKDRAFLSALTEVEREKELFKRMERREALKARHVIERRLKAASSKDYQSSFNDNNTVSSRPKRNLVKSNQQTIDLIRNKRRKRRFECGGDHRGGSISSTDSQTMVESLAAVSGSVTRRNHSSSTSLKSTRKQRYLNGNFSDDNSEEEFDDTFKKKSLTQITTLDEFNKLRISRHKLALWVYQPFFERRIPGFLVRFANAAGSSLSSNDNANQNFSNTYQAYEIVEILKSNKSYKLESSLTNKFLRVRRGNDDRVIRMQYVSNQQFTESEFASYMEDAKRDGRPTPTVEDVEKKQSDLKFCIDFRPTERDIDYVVEQKNKFRKVPVNITAERHKVQVKIEEAKQKNDAQLVVKFENELKNLDEQLEILHQNRARQLDKIRLINERNRRSNIAQLEKVMESESASWSSSSEMANLAANNPFVRRRTNPMILSDKKLQNHFSNRLKQGNSPKNLPPIDETKRHLSPNDVSGSNLQAGAATKEKDKISSKPRHPYDISKDLENLYNFELDISLDLQPQSSSNAAASTSSSSPFKNQKPKFI